MAPPLLQQLLDTGTVRRPAAEARAPLAWELAELAGRLVEISASTAPASLSVAVGLVLQAQQAGEPVAWVTCQDSIPRSGLAPGQVTCQDGIPRSGPAPGRVAKVTCQEAALVACPGDLYPPDLATSGVDLCALPVIHVPGPLEAFRAAELLVRSGAFGLVVLDLGRVQEMPRQVQSRLSGLAQKHDAALVCLTCKPDDAPSLGSLVSLRALARHRGEGPGRFLCLVNVVKDKRRGPGWSFEERCSAPVGLR